MLVGLQDTSGLRRSSPATAPAPSSNLIGTARPAGTLSSRLLLSTAPPSSTGNTSSVLSNATIAPPPETSAQTAPPPAAPALPIITFQNVDAARIALAEGDTTVAPATATSLALAQAAAAALAPVAASNVDLNSVLAGRTLTPTAPRPVAAPTSAPASDGSSLIVWGGVAVLLLGVGYLALRR